MHRLSRGAHIVEINRVSMALQAVQDHGMPSQAIVNTANLKAPVQLTRCLLRIDGCQHHMSVENIRQIAKIRCGQRVDLAFSLPAASGV